VQSFADRKAQYTFVTELFMCSSPEVPNLRYMYP